MPKTTHDIIWLSGGNLNSKKCFYYSFQPTINFNKNSIVYKPLQLSQPITMKKYANDTHVPPCTACRTLGIFISSDGSASAQMKQTIQKAKGLYGKISNSSLSVKAKWVASETIIELSISYPLVNTYFNDRDIRPLECVMSTLCCSALALKP
jgi:hypothetical protein